MPVKLSPPIEQEFVLERTDKEYENKGEATRITVTQAREGAHMERMALWKEFKRTLELSGDVSITQSVSPAEVKRKEVFLTLKSCNLQDDQGKEIFTFPLQESSFNRAWATLPPLIAGEIHEKVLQVNLIWSAEGEIELIDILNTLRDDLREYHGEENEVKMGARATVREKPDALVVYEMLKMTGLPLVAGGLLDQPHIWMLQYEIVDGAVKTHKHQDEVDQRLEEKRQLEAMMAKVQQR